jgi:hypothetical protein
VTPFDPEMLEHYLPCAFVAEPCDDVLVGGEAWLPDRLVERNGFQPSDADEMLLFVRLAEEVLDVRCLQGASSIGVSTSFTSTVNRWSGTGSSDVTSPTPT